MCGISGFIIKNNIDKCNINKYILCLQKYLYNRGPDGSNYYINNNIALIHNRLAIVDLNDRSSQPFIFNNLVMIFNGEIYNYLELKDFLINNYNCEFNTNSDTEVLIQLFYYLGVDKTLELLNGIFIICLYNKDTNDIILIRDRIGIKYCYYYNDDDIFIFASNPASIVKTLYDVNNKKWSVNTNSLFSYLSSGICLTKESLFENIFGLDCGTILIYNNLNYNIKTWYTPNFNRQNDDIHIYIKRAIKLQETGDVGKNILYSGGIDSSILAYYSNDSEFISIDFGEITYAKNILDILNKKIKIIEPEFLNNNMNIFIEEQRKIINFTGIPTKASYIMNMTGLYLKEKEPYNKILLTGIGGNELFYGHRRILTNNNGFKNHVKDLYLFLSQIKPLDNKYKKLFENFKTNLIENIYKEINIPKNLLDINIPRWLEIKTFLLNDLLLNADAIYMYYSIEARVPLLDHNIYEIALSKLPDDFFYKNINNPTWDEYTINSKKILKDILLEKIDNKLINKEKYTYDVERHKIHPLYLNLCNQFIKRNIVGWNGMFTKYNSHLIGNIELWFQEFEYLLII
jgi:asparagine synthase (glutamine-hydrolysing)